MSSWNDGYVSDIEYIPGYYPNQAPAHLDLTCLLKGIAPPGREGIAPPGRGEGGFSWCELGCGLGLTASLLAAAHPEGTFHGIDFHPGQIASARAAAEAAGLGNIAFHAASFQDAAEDPALPLFDYVTIHGVYSWVSEEAKRSIVRFLDRRVKPGGAVLVSYNTVPGWSRIAPLQPLLRAHAEAGRGSSDRRVRSALDFARALKQAGSQTLDDVDLDGIEAPLSGRSREQHDAYLAHEYLDIHWRPLLHSDVAGDFAQAGLSYAGSARVFQNAKELVLTDAQRAVLDGIADPVLRESLSDYCGQPMLRYDVFVREPRRLSAEETERGLRAVPLVQIRHDIALPFTIDGKGRPVVLETDSFAPVFEALQRRICTVGELADLAGGALPARDLAIALVGCDIAWPVSRPAPLEPLPDAVRRFNLLQVAEALRQGEETVALAASVGAGIAITRIGGALYEAMADGGDRPVPEIMARVMDRLGESAPLQVGTDPMALQAAAARRLGVARELEGSFLTLPPLWRRAGCL